MKRKVTGLLDGKDEIVNENFDKILLAVNDFEDIEIETSSADSDFVLNHNLGRTPSGLIVLKQDRAGSIYWQNYDTAETTFLVLRASVANMRLKIRLY